MTMLIETWRWRYKDPVAGQIVKTTARMTADEAAPYPYARRIPGTLAYHDAPRSTPGGSTAPLTARII